ncbi:MAG: hypothetical protein LC725_08075 [Lentisphaerae bacterium]|nr:hypothetical protein [Lentisphaerota bacterium]
MQEGRRMTAGPFIRSPRDDLGQWGTRNWRRAWIEPDTGEVWYFWAGFPGFGETVEQARFIRDEMARHRSLVDLYQANRGSRELVPCAA